MVRRIFVIVGKLYGFLNNEQKELHLNNINEDGS